MVTVARLEKCYLSMALRHLSGTPWRLRELRSLRHLQSRILGRTLRPPPAITGVKIETFKKRLDDWLRNVPDEPRIDDYGASVAAETNSIVHQVRYA